jgi:transcriptional regulator of acetoin/glycerol metabolism
MNLSPESFDAGDMGNRPSRHSDIALDRVIEYRSLQTSHPNVLLEGADAAIDAVLAVLMPYLATPVRIIPRGAPLELAAEQRGALVLRDINSLAPDDQQRLIQCLDDSRFRIQIVATSSMPLFSVVARGLFDVQLYYRLNVMLLRLKSTSDGGFQVHASNVDKSKDWRDPSPA